MSLSAQQRSLTLSQKGKKKSARNILQSPFRNDCKPLQYENSQVIFEALCKSIIEIDNKNVNESESSTQGKSARRRLAVGSNEVLRGIEKRELAAVMVSSEVAVLRDRLVTSCLLTDCPCVVVATFSQAVKSTLGVASVTALGCKKGTDELSPLSDVISAIESANDGSENTNASEKISCKVIQAMPRDKQQKSADKKERHKKIKLKRLTEKKKTKRQKKNERLKKKKKK